MPNSVEKDAMTERLRREAGPASRLFLLGLDEPIEVELWHYEDHPETLAHRFGRAFRWLLPSRVSSRAGFIFQKAAYRLARRLVKSTPCTICTKALTPPERKN